MISFLRGIPVIIEKDYVVLDVNGVGYAINVPINVAATLEKKETTLFTHMSVREDNVSLYGFDSRQTLTYFKLLINVSGIGPKGALAILSTLSNEELVYAIASNDSKAVAKAPGIGQKTAAKAILELKDKIDINDITSNTLSSISSNDNSTIQAGKDDKEIKDAILALCSLGYSNSQALKAINACDISPKMKSDDILKIALKEMIKLGF